VPTATPNADALVILSFANIPTTQYSYPDINGSIVTDPGLESAAQTLTLVPGTALQVGDYVPPGSSQAIANALNAGKQVVVITYNSAYWNTVPAYGNGSPGSDFQTLFMCASEHEPGHALGLGDAYQDPNSPMRGGGECGNSPTVPISPAIAATLQAIQQQQSNSLKLLRCLEQPTSTNPNPNTGLPIGNYVPIYPSSSADNPSTVIWAFLGGHLKCGHRGSLQNRPTDRVQD